MVPALLSTMRLVTQQRIELELRVRRISDRIECERIWNTPGVIAPFHILRWSRLNYEEGSPGWRVGSFVYLHGRLAHPKGRNGRRSGKVVMTGVRCRSAAEHWEHLLRKDDLNDARIAAITGKTIDEVRRLAGIRKEPVL